MADPFEVWRAEDGRSRQKSVRTFWPALADALDGSSAAAPDAPEQPRCVYCAGAEAAIGAVRGRDGEPRPMGVFCFGKLRDKSVFTRNPAWRPGARPRGYAPPAEETWKAEFGGTWG